MSNYDKHLEDTRESWEESNTIKPTKVWCVVENKARILFSSDNEEEASKENKVIQAENWNAKRPHRVYLEYGWILDSEYNQKDFLKSYKGFNPVETLRLKLEA